MKLNASTPEAHTPEAHTPVDMVTATHRMSNARPPGSFSSKRSCPRVKQAIWLSSFAARAGLAPPLRSDGRLGCVQH